MIKFPVAIFAGGKDIAADPTDVIWVRNKLESQLVYYEMLLEFDHFSFAIAKDMSYFTKNVMSIINHYSNKCDPSTADSKFTIGN